MSRLWEKGIDTDELVLKFTVGEDFLLDERLVRHDVEASIAHVTMLSRCGLVSESERDVIVDGLRSVGETHARGGWSIAREEEDAHTAIENRLVDVVGEVGKKVHLARSRNDQVLAALRLYLRDEVAALSTKAAGVVEALTDLAGRHEGVELPGYTHLQQAMPSSVEQWAGGFAGELKDDIRGLTGSITRINRNPLGSVAGYGAAGLPIDRSITTELLAFDETQAPVTSVQLSRGKAEARIVFELALLAADLGRLAADLVLFASSEFGFVRLADSITTGSSVMPQKRNPDVFELVRSRSTQVQAWLSEIMLVTTKMTSGYHRDFQIIKEPLFRSIDLGHQLCDVMAHALDHVHFVEENITMDPAIHAAELAYRLVVEESISFRDAYRRIAVDKPWQED